MSDNEDVQISDSEEARACVSRLLKAIENWAVKESNKNELEVTAFAAALASGIISFHDFSIKLPELAIDMLFGPIKCTSSLPKRWKS